jgi:anti-sigma factor RsiW
MKPTDATTMTRYLLGQLPAAEREACEQEWFTDQAQYIQLCEAENALIDDYVRGLLHGENRALFEQHFLTLPARRERVLTAQALVQTIDAPVAPTASWWQRWRAQQRVPALLPAFTMALLMLLVAGGLWSFWQSRKLKAQLLEQARATSAQQRRAEELAQSLAAERAANVRLTEELARRNNPPTPQLTASVAAPKTLLFALTAGVLRSDSGETLATLKLTRNIERVRLQVKLPAHEFKQFAVTLRTAEGRALQSWTTNATGTRLTLALTTQQLAAGDYALIVSGVKTRGEIEEFRRVPFRVTR